MEAQSEAEMQLQPLDDPTLGQAAVPKGDCDSWSRLQAGPVPSGVGSSHWTRFPGRVCDPWETHTGAVCEELQPTGRTLLEKWRTVSCGKDPAL